MPITITWNRTEKNPTGDFYEITDEMIEKICISISYQEKVRALKQREEAFRAPKVVLIDNPLSKEEAVVNKMIIGIIDHLKSSDIKESVRRIEEQHKVDESLKSPIEAIRDERMADAIAIEAEIDVKIN